MILNRTASYSMTVVIPGWSEGPDPESRDSGFDASHRPGMTSILIEEMEIRMTGAETLDVARDAIWTIVVVSSPLMVVGLVVGVVVSLFQALTQIQEQTLVSVRDRVIQSYEDIMKMPI